MTLWVFVTTVSVTAAVACAAIAWRLRREQRSRSDARIAALASAIDPARGESPLLFSPEHSSFPHDHPLLKIAAGFVLVVTVVLAVALVSDRGDDRASGVRAPGGAQLTLLSMRHERIGDTLTITGLVRNHGVGSAEGITATVLAFDRAGSFVASGRAPIDLGTLAPGEESPFRVAIPHVADVARYQISFRDAAGPVRHVDRRRAASDSTTVAASSTSRFPAPAATAQ